MPITRSTNQRQVQVDLKYREHFTQVTKGSSYQHHGCCTTTDTKGAPYSQHGDQPLCININNNANFELKSGFIHLLLIFNWLAREDPHTHLKEFHMACVGMKPYGVDKEQVKLKAFPFTLKWQQKHGFSLFFLVPLELGMAWRRFFLKGISQPLELPT